MVYRILLATVVLMLCGCTGIGAPGSGGSKGPDPAKLSSADVTSVAAASNQFAFELYRQLDAGSGNMLFSPYSLSSALSMTYEGARGETATQMQAVLHVPEDSAVWQPAF